jgi:hypothetical protein
VKCARRWCRGLGTEMVDEIELCSGHAHEAREKRPAVIEGIKAIHKAPVFMIEVNADNDPVGLYDSVSGRRWRLEEEI